MFKNIKRISLVSLMMLVFISANLLKADITPEARKEYKNSNEILRTPTGVFDNQRNTVSNVQFYTSNYGIFGLDVARLTGGGFWPRGSANQYIFGGGIWLAAQKRKNPNDDFLSTYVLVSYNPNNGKSWFVPGRINKQGPDGPLSSRELNYDPSDIYTYRTFLSVDYRVNDGEPLDGVGPKWPIWDSSDNPNDTLKYNRYFGKYIPENADRNMTTIPKGPAFISGEDIFATYKDTDLTRYDDGPAVSEEKGYPLYIQYEQMIYSWGFGAYRDFIFLKYSMTNYSSDTLWNCWVAPALDIDIAVAPNTAAGAQNDRARFYEADTTMNLAFQWSETDRGELGRGFGYLGFNFLESPAVVKYFDTTFVEEGGVIIDTILTERAYNPNAPNFDPIPSGFVRKDSAYYHESSQLGLQTFRNWNIDFDPQTEESRYNFITDPGRDPDTGPGDKRFLMGTGPFNMMPHDSIRIVVGIILANTSKGGEADGTDEDVQELIARTRFAQTVYDNNFQAPTPPNRNAFLQYTPLNNGVIINWDSTAEMSMDNFERGLDFMGYTLFRARRPDIDYNPNTIAASASNPRGQGPLGWKEIASWSIPTPFVKSPHRGGLDPDNTTMPMIDQFRIVGPYLDNTDRVVDTMAVRVMKVPRGVVMTDDSIYAANNGGNIQPGIRFIDTTFNSKPWGPHYYKMFQRDLQRVNATNLASYPGGGAMIYSTRNNLEIFDSVMVGVAYLNRALIPYNPLFFERKSVTITPEWLAEIRKVFPDLIKGDTVHVYADPENPVNPDTVRTSIDTIFVGSTMKQISDGGGNFWTIDIKVPRHILRQTRDKAHLDEVLDSLYSYIQQGLVELEFPDFEQSHNTRQNIIVPYMAEQTNGRTFYDIGDDDGSATVRTSDKPEDTERLLNNIDYYYKLIASDEGDYTQPIEGKSNDASDGLPNYQVAVPGAAPISDMVKFEVIEVDSAKIGGLYNFQFFSVDSDRALQLFAGDTLTLEFEPYWTRAGLNFGGSATAYNFGTYASYVTLRNDRTNQKLFEGTLNYELRACSPSWTELMTEDAASAVFANPDSVIVDCTLFNAGQKATCDTVLFHRQYTKGQTEEIRRRIGEFTTGNFTDPGFCYALYMDNPAYGTLGFSFDFALEQYGGRFGPDSLTLDMAKTKYGVTATTPINFKDSGPGPGRINNVLTTQFVAVDFNTNNYMAGSFNNGPGEYEVTFKPGGQETLDLAWQQSGQLVTNTFIVDYLEVDIENVKQIMRPNPDGTDSAIVRYPGMMQHMFIDTVAGLGTDPNIQRRLYPDPRNLGQMGENQQYFFKTQEYKLNTNKFIGNYNLSAYGWINSRNLNPATTMATTKARPNLPVLRDNLATNVGQQGRYYLSARSVDGQHQIDFNHNLNIAGVTFVLDYANRRRFTETSNLWDNTYYGAEYAHGAYQYGPDFKAGDKIVLKTRGGAFGLPQPGAKVKVKISDRTEVTNITDKMMDNIQIAPNPYYISHQGVKSPYDSKLYFNKLPARCTIEIYTTTGDLIQTLQHNEYDSEASDRMGVEVWDLMSQNKQRIQSQTLVAVITTPDGAKTVKNFTVIVGGYRLITE